ncbi:hypothetical protein D3C80_2144510 [compost metagenome]
MCKNQFSTMHRTSFGNLVCDVTDAHKFGTALLWRHERAAPLNTGNDALIGQFPQSTIGCHTTDAQHINQFIF